MKYRGDTSNSNSKSHAVVTPSAESDDGQDPYRFSWSLIFSLILMATCGLIVSYSTGLFSLVGPPLLESYPTSTDRLAIPEPFDEYVEKFQKVYESPEEREERKAIFYTNLDTIQEHNFYKHQHQPPFQNNTEKGFTYAMGINQWMDRRLPEELPLGLRKKKKSGSTHPWEESALLASKRTASQDFYQHWLETTVVSVADLPTEVDWRTHQPSVVTPVKQQGMCGSCWAVASATVLESHVALRTGKLFTLSPQELVSCVENPLHCGGSGGCTGATYELAFDYVVEHGVVLDAEFPYTSGTTGKDGQCSLDDASRASVHDSKESFQSQDVLRGAPQSRSVLPVDTTTTIDSDFVDGAVATIQGYVNFPTNNYTLLMNAVATLGPIGVTVAANGWGLYSGGVFSLKSHNTTDATDVNHAVVLEGYGVDQETQEPYWLVRNSWGSSWGEGGYIRLARLDPSTLPDADFDKDDCGTDTKPSDGAGCTKDKDGNDIVPEPIKVCGTSAILYDTFVPIGGRLLAQSNGAASDATGTSPVVEFRRRM